MGANRKDRFVSRLERNTMKYAIVGYIAVAIVVAVLTVGILASPTSPADEFSLRPAVVEDDANLYVGGKGVIAKDESGRDVVVLAD